MKHVINAYIGVALQINDREDQPIKNILIAIEQELRMFGYDKLIETIDEIKDLKVESWNFDFKVVESL